MQSFKQFLLLTEAETPTAKQLGIYYADRVKGPVLSLLQLARTTDIHFNGSSKEAWLKIVQNHIRGDKDVLKCQEELIDAGLKEFAKL